MNDKRYTIDLTAEDVDQIYCFFKMSWCPQDCEITKPSELEETITKIWKEIREELKGKICKNCNHYAEKKGCLCCKYRMQVKPTNAACISFYDANPKG